jgi:hypothetical protein
MYSHSLVNTTIYINIGYRRVESSRPVYYSISNSFGQKYKIFDSYLPQLRKFYGFLVALLRLDIHRWPHPQFWRAKYRESNPRLTGEY